MATKVFISYRRDVSRYQARMIHAAFCQVIPRDQVFMDVDSIPPGANFRKILKDWVNQCEVLLALIGPGWIDASDPKTNRRRLDNPSDFVRIEIGEALARDIPVVPVLIDGAPLPEIGLLPDDLKELADRQAEFVEYRTFDADVERLIRKLRLDQGVDRAKRRRKAEAEKRRRDEDERRRQEAEAKQRADEEERRGKADAEKRRRDEDERRRQEAEAKQRVDEQERRGKADAEKRQRDEEERRRQEAEIKQQTDEEEGRRKAEAEERRRTEEEHRRQEKLQEEARQRAEEERRREEAQTKRRLDEAEAEKRRRDEEWGGLEKELKLVGKQETKQQDKLWRLPLVGAAAASTLMLLLATVSIAPYEVPLFAAAIICALYGGAAGILVQRFGIPKAVAIPIIPALVLLLATAAVFLPGMTSLLIGIVFLLGVLCAWWALWLWAGRTRALPDIALTHTPSDSIEKR
jgi:hypothetical protein